MLGVGVDAWVIIDSWPWMLATKERSALRATDDGQPAHRNQAGQGSRYVLHEAATVFRISDVRLALPGVGDQVIRLALETLTRAGLLVADGTGRGATWRETGPHQPG